MFTLAISCLTTSNLPWFMDLTFQVPMQYCSLQHRTLLLSPVTSTTGCCFCFGFSPHIQGKRNPSKTVGTERGHQRAYRNHNRRQLANLITWTTALSNSMKLSHAMWGHPGRMGHGREVWQNVVHWRREWQTTSVFLPWKPHEQYEKAKG